MSVAATRTGVGVPRIGTTFTTEFTVTAFQLAMGLFGGLGAIVAARRLETIDRDVYLSELAIPVLIGGISTVIGASLLPTAR